MSYLKLILASALVALSIIFMIQNLQELSHQLAIRLNLYVFQFETTPFPTYLVILLAFFTGLLLASLLGLAERFRMRRTIRSQHKDIQRLQKELANERTLAITSDNLIAAPAEDEAPAQLAPPEEEAPEEEGRQS